MILSRSIAKASIAAFLFFVSLSFSVAANAQDGKALFSANCASCHAPHKKLAGPALAGVESRWSSKENLYSWIRNSAAFLKTGDAYANNLYNEYNKIAMNAFPTLKDAEIDAILTYINSVPDPSKAPVAGEGAGAAANVEADNSLLFGILTLILAVVALIMLQVNSNLKKLADDKTGQPALEPIPFWRNKAYIAMVTVVLFSVDKIEAKFNKVPSTFGFNIAPNLNVLPSALLPLETNPPA